jgi:hypothetical protein
MTDTLYCTIDTSRVGEEERSKAQPGAVRKAIEEEIRTMEGQANWRCAAVIRDARNMERIKIVCRGEADSNESRKRPGKLRQGESECCETNCNQLRWTTPTDQPFSTRTEKFYLVPPKS